MSQTRAVETNYSKFSKINQKDTLFAPARYCVTLAPSMAPKW